mmetsp:Transcript_9117/g.22726  ORF Transcript_9117/g.22726 Transcript_9117/m.22726 type:complete len:304 (+) Transcript_9117:17-928(+)
MFLVFISYKGTLGDKLGDVVGSSSQWRIWAGDESKRFESPTTAGEDLIKIEAARRARYHSTTCMSLKGKKHPNVIATMDLICELDSSPDPSSKNNGSIFGASASTHVGFSGDAAASPTAAAFDENGTGDGGSDRVGGALPRLSVSSSQLDDALLGVSSFASRSTPTRLSKSLAVSAGADARVRRSPARIFDAAVVFSLENLCRTSSDVKLEKYLLSPSPSSPDSSSSSTSTRSTRASKPWYRTSSSVRSSPTPRLRSATTSDSSSISKRRNSSRSTATRHLSAESTSSSSRLSLAMGTPMHFA